VDGIGVALDSVRLAERELRDGRLVIPLAGRSRTLTLIGHRLVFPAGADRKPALAKFTQWLLAELDLSGGASPIDTAGSVRSPGHR
jgi:LysR family transcriptional regulator, glycine cleavage system transcriptional activator